MDDILVATSVGRFIAVQAETTVNLSSGADGSMASAEAFNELANQAGIFAAMQGMLAQIVWKRFQNQVKR